MRKYQFDLEYKKSKVALIFTWLVFIVINAIFLINSTYKKKEYLKNFNLSLSNLLFDPAERKDIITLRRTIQNIQMANPNIKFCIKIDGVLISKDTDICNKEYTSFYAPLTRKKLEIYSKDTLLIRDLLYQVIVSLLVSVLFFL